MKTKDFVVALMILVSLFFPTLLSAGSLLPPPTGEYAVATRLLEPFVDESRPDERFESGYRTLVVQLWYPSSETEGTRSRYFIDSALVDEVKAESSVPARVETWRDLQTNAIDDGAITEGRFPLVLFSHGFGMARAYYTTWIEELVSHGFIVAAIDHPFSGLTRIDEKVFGLAPHPGGPDGETSVIAADLVFLLPTLIELPGVDAGRIAAVGHSIGGAAALAACGRDRRLTGCVNLDGAPFGEVKTGVGRPFMVIHQKPVFPDAKPDGELAKIGREVDREWREIIAKQDDPVVRLSVRGTGHLSFSDALFLRPELVEEGGGDVADPLEVLRQTTSVIVQYLRNTFEGHPGAELDLPDLVAVARLGEVSE